MIFWNRSQNHLVFSPNITTLHPIDTQFHCILILLILLTPMNPLNILRIEIVKRPIFNLLLVLLAIFGGNLGLAIIVLTLIIRLLLIKNALAATKMQWQMGSFGPKMQEIQDKHKDDPQQMSSEMMNLFKKDGGGPLKWCMTMLVQIPVFLGLFYNVKDIATGEINVSAYSFLEWLNVNFDAIQTMFLGIDLLAANNILLTVLAAILMYAQMKFTTMIKPASTPKLPGVTDKAGMPDMSKMMGSMNIIFVVMMGAFVRSMPAAIGLYIITTTLFWVIQYTVQYRPVLKAKYLAWRGVPQIIEEE